MPTPMTLATLTTRVRALTNIHSTARLSDADIEAALQEANTEIGDAKPWPHLRRVDAAVPVSTAGLLSLPANARSVQYVLGADGKHLPHELVNGVWWTSEQSAAGTVTVAYLIETPDLSPTVGPFVEATFHPLWAYVAAGRILEQKGADPRKVETLAATASSLADRMRRRYILSSSTEVLTYREQLRSRS